MVNQVVNRQRENQVVKNNPYLWIVPANEGSKEEGGKENVLMSSRHCH